MKTRIIPLLTVLLTLSLCGFAQQRRVQNKPYMDQRLFHFGILVGTHLQDIEFQNTGLATYLDDQGAEHPSHVVVDQDRWDAGFTVGALGELRLSSHLQFRIAPALLFGTRHLTYRNLMATDARGNAAEQQQELKTAYISSACDLIFGAERFNNYRPYVMVGINPMFNLSNGSSNEYIRLQRPDVFLEIGVGCDFYLPFFKLRPELKFMYGLTDVYDKSHATTIKDKNMLPYTMAAKAAHSKMVALTFYFE